MVSMPAQASINTANANGPSNPENQGASRCRHETEPNFCTMERIIPPTLFIQRGSSGLTQRAWDNRTHVFIV